MIPNAEFQEIAHCGGKVTFAIKTDGESLSYSVKISHDRPTPASWFGVYALHDSQPVADMPIGGVGPSGGAPPPPGSVPVLIAADRESYFGHSCISGCEGYWRAPAAPTLWPMTCPYCGTRRPTYAFRSPAQLAYINHYVETLNGALADLTTDGEVVIDMDEIVESAGSQTTPDFYSAEVSQQCRFACETCGTRNDILGHFGFCCCCGARNNMALFRSTVSTIVNEHTSGKAASEMVKRLVSAYESCGRNYVGSLMARIPMTGKRAKLARQLRFQNVTRSSKSMGQIFDIDPLKGVSYADEQFATLMFSRRHVFEHNAGVADEKYLDESGDDTVKIGQAIRETSMNATRLGPILLEMMANIDRGFRDVFPPEKTAASLKRRS